MKTKKIYIIAILILIFYLFFSMNSIVQGRKITWDEIKDRYAEDKTLSFLKGEENKNELEEWQDEVKAKTALIYDMLSMGIEDPDYALAMEISAALQTVNSSTTTDETDDDLIKNYTTHNDIRNWLKAHDGINLSNKVKEKWIAVVNADSKSSEYAKEITIKMINGTRYADASAEVNQENNGDKPSTGVLGQANASSSHTPDEVIDEADGFISKGQSEGSKINGEALKDASNTLYNILLIIGIFLAVAIGMYLGIKFMLSSAEDRAKVKESLVPYIAGCVVIFGAFIIWKLAITLLSNLA